MNVMSANGGCEAGSVDVREDSGAGMVSVSRSISAVPIYTKLAGGSKSPARIHIVVRASPHANSLPNATTPNSLGDAGSSASTSIAGLAGVSVGFTAQGGRLFGSNGDISILGGSVSGTNGGVTGQSGEGAGSTSLAQSKERASPHSDREFSERGHTVAENRAAQETGSCSGARSASLSLPAPVPLPLLPEPLVQLQQLHAQPHMQLHLQSRMQSQSQLHLQQQKLQQELQLQLQSQLQSQHELQLLQSQLEMAASQSQGLSLLSMYAHRRPDVDQTSECVDGEGEGEGDGDVDGEMDDLDAPDGDVGEMCDDRARSPSQVAFESLYAHVLAAEQSAFAMDYKGYKMHDPSATAVALITKDAAALLKRPIQPNVPPMHQDRLKAFNVSQPLLISRFKIWSYSSEGLFRVISNA